MLFHFKNFSLYHENSTLKIGTDSVLLASVVPVDDVTSLLDIGTGCGVIAFCLADKLTSAKTSSPLNSNISITGIDIDADSIEEAITNKALFLQNHNIDIEFQNIDLQHFISNNNSSFDLIVSNPPYFANSLKPDNNRKKLSKHRDSNLPFQMLIHHVNRLLSPKGKFFLILPVDAFSEFQQLVSSSLHQFYQLNIRPNSNKNINRIIAGYQKNESKNVLYEELKIRDSFQNYTEPYKLLTNQFYL